MGMLYWCGGDMAIIEGFRLKNYRSLQNIQIGKLWNTQNVPLTPLTVVIGKNGVGKSTLFDAFGFLADCLKVGVEDACDIAGRNGFNKIRSKGTQDPIEIEIYYRQDGNSRPIRRCQHINLSTICRAWGECNSSTLHEIHAARG